MAFSITQEEKRYLLALARKTIAAEWERTPAMPLELPSVTAGALEAYCGAFVSLHEGNSLRGCIGNMEGRRPLPATIRAMARAAAFEDPRFPPLSRDELDRCVIEISVLSPLSPCSDPHSVVVGTHGVYLTRYGRSGVFLPQVPVEQGWSQKEYLDHLCLKAGLPPDSYESSDAALYTFTAVVFSEKD